MTDPTETEINRTIAEACGWTPVDLTHANGWWCPDGWQSGQFTTDLNACARAAKVLGYDEWNVMGTYVGPRAWVNHRYTEADTPARAFALALFKATKAKETPDA